MEGLLHITSFLISSKSTIQLSVEENVTQRFVVCQFFWQFYSCLMWMSWLCSSLMWTIYDHFTSLMWISQIFLLISLSCLVTFINITFHHQSLQTVISKVPVWNKKYNSPAVLQYILLAGYHWKQILHVDDTTECCRECYSIICCL